MKFHRRYFLWKAPLYIILLPRDLIDVPVKALSSIPGVNLVLAPELMIVNFITAGLVWSYTDYGFHGAFDAWRSCTMIPNRMVMSGRFPLYIDPRNYFPNLRSIEFVREEIVVEGR